MDSYTAVGSLSKREHDRTRHRRRVGVEQRRYLDDVVSSTLVGAVPT